MRKHPAWHGSANTLSAMKSDVVRLFDGVAAVGAAVSAGAGAASADPSDTCTPADRVTGSQTCLDALIDPSHRIDATISIAPGDGI